MTPDWSRALEAAAQHLLAALAAGTAAVCLGAALMLLWERMTRADPPSGTYYVGRRDATSVAVYFVAHSHIARVVDPLPEPAWGAGADAEPLAAAMLRHRTGRRQPPAREVSALGMWLEIQPRDGFVLEGAELARIVGAPLAGRRRPRSDGALRAP